MKLVNNQQHQDAGCMFHHKYRPDIDGLRAVAVICVVGYHAFPSVVLGGFIGVDIFFVISGYLISSIILSSLNTGCFSLYEFYVKRVRRIFPALFVVMFASLVWGWFMLFPAEYVMLGKQVAAGSAFIANILFWRESGYFGTSSELKPFLHLWSLGIEEQFYFVWPLILLVSFKLGRRVTLVTLLLILLASFLLNAAMVTGKPTATFFLPVTRFWELLIGAFLAYISIFNGGVGKVLLARFAPKDRDIVEGKLAETMSWIGASLLLGGCLLIDNKRLFPGWWALLPTAGTFLVIAAGPHTWFGRNILAARAMVAIGLISYPLYLWHWPLLSFLKIELGELSVAVRFSAVALAFFLAWTTYKFIEKPLRTSKFPPVFLLLAVGVGVLGVVGVLIFKGGIAKSANDEQSSFADSFENAAPMYRYFVKHNLFATYRLDCDYYDLLKNDVKKTINASCYTPVSKNKVLIWGDSHAQQLNYGLTQTLHDDISLLQVATSGCNPSLEKIYPDVFNACNKSNAQAYETVAKFKPELVLLAQNSGHEFVDWETMAAKLKALGVKNVWLIGPVPHWQPELYKIMARPTNRLPRLSIGLKESEWEVDGLLKSRYQQSTNIRYISLMDTLCNKKEGCLSYIGDQPIDGITTFDYGHLTSVASLYVARQALAPLIIKVVADNKNENN